MEMDGISIILNEFYCKKHSILANTLMLLNYPCRTCFNKHNCKIFKYYSLHIPNNERYCSVCGETLSILYSVIMHKLKKKGYLPENFNLLCCSCKMNDDDKK